MAGSSQQLAAPLSVEVSGEGSIAWFPEPSGEPQDLQPGWLPRRGSRLRAAAVALGAAVLGLLALAGAAGQIQRQRAEAAAPQGPAPGEASLELLSLHSVTALDEVDEDDDDMEGFDEPPLQQGLLRATGANATGLPFAPVRELGNHHCLKLLNRFKTLNTQKLAGHSKDPQFPDSVTSIASPGESCGDAAANIHKSCDVYNHWATFQAVAKRLNKHYEVMAAKGPEYTDIGQGQLGTCYFLAALASIASSDPKVIQNMFIDRSKWAQNVYTTKWLLDGKETTIRVDNKVPAHHSGGPYFVQPSETGEWWPVILEKSWAKIFGTFKAIEGGIWENAVQAITMAPVERHKHKDNTVAKIWDLLTEATSKGWPMGAGTGPNCVNYGLAKSHAYSVIKAFVKSGYGKVVTLFNPWNSDKYHGKVPNHDRRDGVFTMTIDEFFDAFRQTSLAKVNDAYTTTSQLVQTEPSKITSWEFSVSSHEPFHVSLSWPGHRMVKPCKMMYPAVTLEVAVKGSGKPVAPAPKVLGLVSSVSVEVTQGPGDYTVLAGLNFPATDVVHEGHLVVYGPSAVTIKQGSESSTDLAARMLGPTSGGNICTVVTFPGEGAFTLDKAKTMYGLPTYWSFDKAVFAYWVGMMSKWFVVPKKYWDQVASGKLLSTAKMPKSQLSCGCQDSPSGVAGFQDVHCNVVKGRHAKFGNVRCSGVAYSPLVQRFCPKTCGAAACANAVQRPSAAATTTPAPTPAPAPAPARHGGGAAAQTCSDEQSPGLTLNGNLASCSELGMLCKEYSQVEDKCCATCASKAAAGDITTGTCQDESSMVCSHLKGQCGNSLVSNRCCKTCKAAAVLGVAGKNPMLCAKSSWTWLQPKDGTEMGACSVLKIACGLDFIKRECCKSCR